MSSFKVYFKPGTYEAGKTKIGLSLEKSLIDFLIAKGIATNPSGDCCTLVPVGGSGGGGATNLTFSRTATSVTVVSDTGTDATLPAATTTQAGVLTATDKTKLDSLSNYTHPNHTGDVTSTGDGATVIANNVVTNVKLAQAPANTLKGNNTGSTANEADLTVAQVKTLLAYTAADISNTPAGSINTSTVQGALNELDGEKQTNITFQEDGTTLGTAGTVTTVNFTGTGVTASRAANVLTVDIPTGGGGSGSIWGRFLQTTSGQTIDVKYFTISGSPVLAFTSASGVGALTVTGGVIEIDRVQVDTGAGKNAWDGSNKYKLTIPTANSGAFLQYPLVNVFNTNGNTAPSTVAPHLVRNPGSTPVVTFVGGTAGTNIEMLTGDLSVVGAGASIVLKF